MNPKTFQKINRFLMIALIHFYSSAILFIYSHEKTGFGEFSRFMEKILILPYIDKLDTSNLYFLFVLNSFLWCLILAGLVKLWRFAISMRIN
jgi:hypothetical protein